MDDVYYKVFSQKFLELKFRFKWYIIRLYNMTIFGACPYVGIGGGQRKLLPDTFQILHVYQVHMQKSSLYHNLQVASPEQPH